MSLLLLCLACAADDDTASLDSGPEGAVTEVNLLGSEVPTDLAPAAPSPGLSLGRVPENMPAAHAPVAPGVLAGTTAEPTASPEVLASSAESCRLPTFAAPEPSPEARLSAWIQGQGGLIGNGQHRMEPGETAWGIATQLDVPVWTLRTMNPQYDLDHLRVGDWLAYPVTQRNENTAWNLYTEEECGC